MKTLKNSDILAYDIRWIYLLIDEITVGDNHRVPNLNKFWARGLEIFTSPGQVIILL